MKKLKYIIIVLVIIYGIYFIFPYFLNVKINKIPSSTIVYDDENNEIGEIIAEKKYRHIEVKSDEISKFLKNIFITIEDKRFYSHSGIDYFGIIRAIKNNLSSKNTQGASTIENQIIRNNFWLNNDRGYLLKLKEFALSLALNKKYSKDEILEIYLNNINFGYLNYGVESASRFYYNKSVLHLTKAETIGLLTIIKNPNKYNPITNLSNFNKRFKVISNSLLEKKVISDEEYSEIINEKLTFFKGKKNLLPYVVDFYGKNKKGQAQGITPTNKLKTPINLNLTNKIDAIAKSSIKTLAWKNVSDYSVIIFDKKSLELKVMIGGNNYYSENGQVNGSLALRQPGSALKPFLYAIYFDKFQKTPSSTILDLPVSYKTADGNSYEPKNYSLDFAGEITLAEALSQSVNIPAVKILNEIGIENFLKFLRNIGITTLNRDGDFYGLSLALGSGEVNLYELTKAYSIFSNGGKYCETPNNCTQILDKKYTDMVEEILTNRYFKLAGFPINSNLDFPDREVFVKTGTSRNFRDNWSIGYTGDYVIGVWVGNKDGSEMKGVSGASGAGDIFRKIVYALDENDSKTKIVNLDKDKKDYLKITSPLPGSVFETNPSIPIKNQDIKLNFSSNLDYDQIKWFLNNNEIKGDFINIMDLKDNNSLQLKLFLQNKEIKNDTIYFLKQ